MGLFKKIVRDAMDFGREKGFYCSVCKGTITEREYKYSMNKFKKALCRSHQQKPFPEKIYKKMYVPRKEPSSHKSTPEARKLFYALKERDVPAELEKWDGHKHIDIAVTDAKVNIEVDGSHHNYSDKQALSDLKRTCFSFTKGFLTLRVPNSLIRNNFEQTVDLIVDFLNKSREELENDWF
jgi:very-short-patch-repair endonuclease